MSDCTSSYYSTEPSFESLLKLPNNFIKNKASVLPSFHQLLETAGITENIESNTSTGKRTLTPNLASRTRLQPSQAKFLITIFAENEFPSTLVRQKVATHLGLSCRTIQNWFQNRRQKTRSIKN